MNTFFKIMELITSDDSIPKSVKLDVMNRVIDWCDSGGAETDEYVTRQLNYLIEVKNHYDKENR